MVRPSWDRSTGAPVIRAVAGLGIAIELASDVPRSHRSPSGSGGVTPRQHCRRYERIAEPTVRIRFPPAESLQTFSSSRAATAMAKPDSSHSRTGSSNPVPSSGESDELLPEQARSPVGSRGCPLLGSRGGDREDQAQRPDKTVGTKHARDKNGR